MKMINKRGYQKLIKLIISSDIIGTLFFGTTKREKLKNTRTK